MSNNSTKDSSFSIDTEVVHAGERSSVPLSIPSSMPIYATSTFTYGSMEELDRALGGEINDYTYLRYGNPTTGALQSAIAKLERGIGAVAYGSGMAALHAALIACELSPGTTVLASQNVFGSTLQLLYQIFGPLGIKTVTADFSDLDQLRETTRTVRPRVLLCETISNPLAKVCDIDLCAEIAREVGARLIIDNTFASPVLCRPLEFGADFSVHSATKYLSGHADAMGGIVIAREEFDMPALLGAMKLVGGVLSPWEAHLIHRGIKTLALRMERQCQNALDLAKFLSSHRAVKHVHYPALQPSRALSRIIRGGLSGAILSIQLVDDTREGAFRFMNRLRLCVCATSLGDVFTGVLHPATVSHREMSLAQRQRLGISDGLVRLSLGIEDIADVIADVEQALAANTKQALA